MYCLVLNRKLLANLDRKIAVLMPFSKVTDSKSFPGIIKFCITISSKQLFGETLDIWKKITLDLHCGSVENCMKDQLYVKTKSLNWNSVVWWTSI